MLYHNTFITDHRITAETVAPIVASGRARWKTENENHNTLKNHGYHLEHNFGHGKQHLSNLLLSLNLLAFLLHTALTLTDTVYQQIRHALGPRRTFFDDIRTLTHYLYFDSWAALLAFMFHGLELDHIYTRHQRLFQPPTVLIPFKLRIAATERCADARQLSYNRMCCGNVIEVPVT